MLAVYIITAIVGGGLIILSALGGGHDHSFEGQGDVDFGGHDVDMGGHDVDVSHGGDVDQAGDAGHGGDTTGGLPWMPFLSLRFWTYFCAVFGVVGVLLTYMGHTPEPAVGIYAGSSGLLTGLAVAIIMRLLRLSDSDSTARANDMLGTIAKVQVALRGEQPGRIRVCVKGDLVDVLALTQDGSTVEAGEEVVVIGVEGDRVTVVPRSEIFD
jgi:membrane protein implicated in regulation of membrane protease activity